MVRVLALVSCATLGAALRRGTRAAEMPHKAVVTTRLLRNSHEGMAALIEAEHQWHQEAGSLLEEGDEATQISPMITVSAAQMGRLKDHQQAVLAQATGMQSSLLEAPVEEPTALKLSSLSTEYVGPIGVGTVFSSDACATLSEQQAEGSEAAGCKAEAQSHVWVVFDTGSTNLWVNSDACSGGACAKPGRLRYDHSKSKSYKAPDNTTDLKVYFGTGQMSGPLAIDDFRVGPLAVHGQTFGMIKEQEGSVFEDYPIEGILGLAFPGLAANGTTAFFENIIAQKALPSNAISFYFSLANPSANAMLWGGTDSKFHTAPIEYFNVTKPHYWGIDLKAFKIGGTDMLTLTKNTTLQNSEGTWEAIIDTGTTYFTAPDEVYMDIMGKLAEIPCAFVTKKSHPDITVTFESENGTLRDLTLDSTKYLVSSGEKGNEQCRPAFMKLSMRGKHAKSMIFGEVFMRNYYTVYDRVDGDVKNARVGFAPAAQGQDVEGHLKTITKDQPLFSEQHSSETTEG